MKIDNFFAELKRRNVYKVAVAYAIVGWLLVQIATQVFPFLEIPTWIVRLVIVLVAAGFPIALVIAWAFELTPEGIKRTEEVDLAASARQPRKYTWIFVVFVGAALSVGLFFIGRYTGRTTTSAAGTELPAKSIAVLPFESLSEEKGNAYFAEGIQDEILTRLAKIADLKVISRTSTQHFKSAPDNLPQIAKQLALIYVGLSDHNEALHWLEQGYREHDSFNIGPIRVDPLLAPLHGDPRFEALAEKIVPSREFGKAGIQK